MARHASGGGIVDHQRVLLPFAFFGGSDSKDSIDVENQSGLLLRGHRRV